MTGSVLLLAGCWVLMFRLLSWNVRGLNDIRKRAVIKSFLRDWRCDLMCLQEIKLDVVSLSVIRSMWGLSSVGFVFLKAAGASGGILVMWIRAFFIWSLPLRGSFQLPVYFKWLKVASLGHLLGFMAPKLELTS